jgi:hypothetical protein
MRVTRFRLFLLCGGAMLLVGPAIGLGQFQGPPGPPPGPPAGFQPGATPGYQPSGFQMNFQGRQGRGFDPNMFFNMMANGKDYITEADYLANPFVARDPSAKDRIEEFMQRMGITNGQLNRDQFAQLAAERMAQRQAQRAAAAANPNNQNPGDPNNPTTSPEAPATDDGTPIPEDKRPTVYRAGNLPPDIPSWFALMDTDHDGQVGLYEWKAAGRSVSDFQAIDLNGDGFITVEEAMRYQKKQGVTVASSSQFPGAPGYNGQPFNGFNQNGLNQNGFNQNGFNRFGNRGPRRRGQFQNPSGN